MRLCGQFHTTACAQCDGCGLSNRGYRKRFSELLPAYSSYARSFASGVAHALEAIVSDSNGIVRIQVAAQEDLELLRAGLAKLPWQRCFVHLAQRANNKNVSTVSRAAMLCTYPRLE